MKYNAIGNYKAIFFLFGMKMCVARFWGVGRVANFTMQYLLCFLFFVL